MTDSEREASIRAAHTEAAFGNDHSVSVLLRLLDEARQTRAVNEFIVDYGNRRAQEARQAQLEEGYCMACGVYHRVGGCAAIEKAARDARAAALLEAARIADDGVTLAENGPSLTFVPAHKFAADLARDIADGIRALAGTDTPPQSEREQIKEARAAAIEEAAQLANDQTSDDPPPGDWNAACGHIADAIRALADNPAAARGR